MGKREESMSFKQISNQYETIRFQIKAPKIIF